MALDVHRNRKEICVTEPLADRSSRGRGVVRAFEVPAHLGLDRGRDQQIALLDTLFPLALDQSLGAAEPSPG